MAARMLLGAMGSNNPLLRPGINVNFLPPGANADLPAPGAQYRNQTNFPLVGEMYPEYHTGVFIRNS